MINGRCIVKMLVCALTAAFVFSIFVPNYAGAENSWKAYFNDLSQELGGPQPADKYGDTYPVIPDGVPDWLKDEINDGGISQAQKKTDFINYIVNDLGTYNINGKYIIQSMRGYGFGNVGYGTDSDSAGNLNDSVIADWKSRIYNNRVGIRVEYISDQLANTWMDSHNVFDIGTTNGESIVFYDTNNPDTRYYVIRAECGNPLGELSLPQSDFNLTPTIRLSDSVIETGASVTVYPSVKNDGSTSSGGTNWWVTKTVNASPRYNYTFGGSYDFNTGSNTDFTNGQDIDDDPVGANVCYTLHVQPRATSDGGEAASAPACVTIGKKPKAQVVGGDLKTRGGTNTSISSITSPTTGQTTTYGSWAEYAISAGGLVVGTSSGMGLIGGQSNAKACDYSVLTFNNDNDDNSSSSNAKCGGSSGSLTPTLGNYSNTGSALPDIVSNFAISDSLPSGSTINPSTLKSGTVYEVDGDLTLGNGDSTLAAGQSIILNVKGTVTINSNQLYTNGPYGSINQIPQLVIIANHIVINDDVTNIDGWLIATDAKEKTGSIKTCSDYSNKTWTINSCNKQLTVNGPVVTDNLYLYRTAKADLDSRAEAAETFNFRADAYLWAYNYASTHAGMKTVYSTELPPRF